MRKLRGRDLLLGIVFPAAISVIILTVGVFGLLLPEFEATMLEQRRNAVRDQADAAWSIINRLHQRAQAGEISMEQAHRRAADALRSTRYGPRGDDYFWVHDMDGQMIVHPYRPDLEGQNQLDLKDVEGTAILQESIRTAANGGGFVDYVWQKPNAPEAQVRKLTYVRSFEPWGWVIATGMYLDDVQAETDRMTAKAFWLLLALLGAVALLLLLLVGRAIHVERARRDAEQARADSEAKYRMIVEHQQDIVTKLDAKGRFLYVSPSFVEVFGWSEEQAIGADFLPLVTQEDQEVALRAMAQIERPPHATYSEQRVKTVDGVRWYGWRNRAVLNADGEIEAVVCCGRDITGRRTAEMAVRASEERLRSLVRVAPMGIGVVDHLKMSDVNDAFCKMLGYERDELIGQHTRLFYSDEQLYRNDISTFGRQLDTTGSADMETRWRRKDGTMVDLLISGTRADGGEDSHKIIFTAVDVTDRKNLEAQLRQSQKMEAVGQLAGGVAHDFNNQLTIIRGYCDLMLDETSIPEEVREQLSHIDNAAARAGRLTSQLLAFSRKQVLRPAVIDLGEVLAEMNKPLARMLGEDIELSVEQDASIEAATCKLDRSQFEQAIINLAVNARDAMPNGGRLVMSICRRNVRTDSGEITPGRYVCLSVRDTGVGMDEHTRQHLFEPFFTTKEVGKGTGLGLSMVYGFVSQSDGAITVESEPKTGTTFHLYFPAVNEPAQPSDRRATGEIAGGRERVLVVEDEPAVRRLIARVLRDIGYDVVETDSTDQALAIGRQEDTPLDMLVADVVMPGCSGPELAAQLLENRPGLGVLYVSGYVRGVAIRRGLIDAYANILSKPFSPKELAAAVRECLDQADAKPHQAHST
jgi:PAS domain S-box-containing protein